MVERGTIGRFARWGLIHGPMWGVAAALLALPLSEVVDFGFGPMGIVLVGLTAGLLGGPLLGALVGASCAAADRAPKWILDAPDYVAVLTVMVVVALVAWPLLGLGQASVMAGILGVATVGVAPVVDAAHNAPDLLHPPPSSQ